MIEYVHDLPVDEYLDMRIEAGWRGLSRGQAEKGIAGSAYTVAARDGEKTAGMARVISDGGYIYLIVDVIVRPAYQGQGIGTHMIAMIDEWLQEESRGKPTLMVYLMAAEGKEGFYERFGFLQRPGEHMGAGMSKWLDRA
jgi:GNAT superfamily N-acetyltransferase